MALNTPVPIYLGKLPKIVWSGHTLTIRYALDNCAAYPILRDGSVQRQISSGEEDAWTAGVTWALSGEVAYIPSTDEAGATGWDGATGWRAFLAYAYTGAAFTFYPDASDATSAFSAVLLHPSMDDPEPVLEDDFTRHLVLTVGRADGATVTGYEPQYRVRIYAPRSTQADPANEITLLTPAAGAPHSDAFAVSTLPEFTEGTAPNTITYKPYLDRVHGRKGQLDFLSKATDKGSVTVDLLDKRLALASNLARWVTAFIGDAQAQNQLFGCRVEIDRSRDGGTSWQRYFTGRVQDDALDDMVSYTLTVRDFMDDLQGDVFIGPPHSSLASWANPAPLFPIGLLQPYGIIEAPAAPGAFWVLAPGYPLEPMPGGTVRNVGATGVPVAVQVDHLDYRTHCLAQALADLADQVTVGQQFLDTFGNSPWSIRLDYFNNQCSLVVPSLGKRYPLRRLFTPADYADGVDKQFRVTGLYGTGMEADTVADSTVVTCYVISNREPTESAPILLSNVHVATLWRAILDGKFGYLDATTGDALSPIVYDTAAFDALEADASLGMRNFRVTEKADRADWTEDHICKTSGLCYRFDEFGKLIPLDLRISAGIAGSSVTLTDADLVAADDAVKWNQTAKDAITRITATYETDDQLSVDSMRDAKPMPDPPGARIESTDTPIILLDNSGRARDIGDYPQDLKCDGFRAFVQADGTVAGRDYVEAELVTLMDDTHAPFQAGATYFSLDCLPGNSDSVQIGTFVTCKISKLPDANGNVRGGTRLAVCVGRDEAEDQLVTTLSFIDLAGGVALDAPSLAPPALGTDTLHEATIALTLDAAGDPAAVYWNATAQSVSVRPADTAAGWHYAGRFTAPGTIDVTTIPSGSRVWWRARTVAAVDGTAGLPSDWVYPTGGTEYVDMDTLSAPTGLSVGSITGSTALAQWTPVSTDGEGDPLEVYLNGVLRTTLFWATKFTFLRALASGTHYVLGIRYRDPYGGVSATVTAAFDTTGTLPTAPDMAGLAAQGGDAAGIGTDDAGQGFASAGGIGIVVTPFPSQAGMAYTVEIERAPDDGSGAADVANAVSLTATWTPASGYYVDQAPNDATIRWYRARSTYVGVTPGAWTCWRSAYPMILPDPVVAAVPVLPKIQAQQSATATVGTLALSVTDVQCRVTLVEMKSKSGNAAETAYAPVSLSGGLYSGTVALVEGLLSTITYRVTGYDDVGVLRVLTEQTVTFAPATMPSPPVLTAKFTASGTLSVDVNGGPTQDHVKLAASTSGEPTDATVRAATPVSGRTMTIATGLTLADGDTATIKAFAYDAAGNESAAAVITAQYHASIAIPYGYNFGFGNGLGALVANQGVSDVVGENGNITAWEMWTEDGVNVSASVDIQVSPGSNPPVWTSLVGAGAKPNLSGARWAQQTSITGWTGVAITAGQLIRPVLSTVDGTVKTVRGFLSVTRT